MIRLSLPIAVAILSASVAQAQSVFLSGATLYDGTGSPPVVDAVIEIRKERLACVGTAEDCPIPKGAEVVEQSGAFVTPGLVDTHVHFEQTGWFDGRPDWGIGTNFYDQEAVRQRVRSHPDRWHRAYLCSGVTAVADRGGFPWTLDVGEGDPSLRVHVQASGPLITHHAPSLENNNFLSMRTDEEAIASVLALSDMGSQAIKVWYLNPPPDEAESYHARLALVGQKAKDLALPLVVHATELDNAKAALRAGADVLVHSVMDQLVDDEFIQLALEGSTYYTPTLVVLDNVLRGEASVAIGQRYPIDDPNGCVDAETLRLVSDADTLHHMLSEERRDLRRIFDRLELAGRTLAVATENLRRVYKAGIPVATGTDAGNPLTFHGPAIYQEMAAMEQAGIPATDVLVMSTRNGAVALGRLDDFGTIEAGKLADLIVLNEDPGTSTSAFRSISHVMKNGVLREIGYFAGR